MYIQNYFSWVHRWLSIYSETALVLIGDIVCQSDYKSSSFFQFYE
jgi:hypothetical protein